MIFYFIQYFFGFALSAITLFRKKLEAIVAPVIILVLAFFAASRGSHVDRDYGIYMNYFQKLTGENVEYFNLNRILIYEPSFYFIPLVSKLAVGAYYAYLSFAIFALLGVWFKFKSFYLSNSFFLSTILYVSFYFFLHEMTQIRIGVASGILLVGIRHLYDRNLAKYALHIFAACCFHYSSIVFLPLYLLGPQTIKKTFWVFAVLIAYSIAILHLDILNIMHLSSLSPKIELYSKAAQEKTIDFKINIFNYGLLLNILITFILMFQSEYLTRRNKYLPLLLKINCLSIISFLALSSLAVFAGRLSELFGIVQIVLYPTLIYVFKERYIGYATCVLISLLSFWNIFYHSKLLQEYGTWWGT